MKQNLEVMKQAANEIRGLAIDMIEKAGSGHPGLPLGCAELGVLLWGKVLRYNPSDPNWINRDRFILSAGHGSAWLYTMLHLAGYAFSLEDLKQFRQFGSKTAGHPEFDTNLGIETTTGPLGQGISNGVGQAMGRKILEEQFPGIFDYKIYVLAGDGDVMEGIASESFSLAGHHKLNDLIVIYDDNRITIDGSTDLSFSEDMTGKMVSLGWKVFQVDAYSWEDLYKVLSDARDVDDKPVFIKMRSIIGKGSATKENDSSVHGAPLGKDFSGTKRNLNLNETISFQISNTTKQFFQRHHLRVKEDYDIWKEKWARYLRVPENSDKWGKWLEKTDSEVVCKKLLKYKTDKPTATRVMNGECLNIVAESIPGLIGGSADLASSVKTFIQSGGVFLPDNRTGRNLYFGIREQAMAGIINGLAQTPGIWPFASTFFVFSDYMRSGIRLSAMMNLPLIYFFSHDSFYVGEDGPTHQPIEHLDALSLIPNLIIFRPGNDMETAAAWRYMIKKQKHPYVVLLTRQDLACFKSERTIEDFDRGIYLFQTVGEKPLIHIIASGSELEKAVKAAKILNERGIGSTVFSAPSLSLFERQPEEYQRKIFHSGIPCFVIEAGSGRRWDRWLNDSRFFAGVRQFGISAPWQELEKYFGLSPEQLAEKIFSILK